MAEYDFSGLDEPATQPKDDSVKYDFSGLDDVEKKDEKPTEKPEEQYDFSGLDGPEEKPAQKSYTEKLAEPLRQPNEPPIGREEAHKMLADFGQSPEGQFAVQAGGTPVLSIATPLADFGTRALKGFLEGGAIQSGDEIHQASLGKGDPTPAVAARILGSGILGAVIGGVTGQRPESAASELKAIQDSKIGQGLSDFIKGVGHSAKQLGPEPEKVITEGIKNGTMFNMGQKFFKFMSGRVPAIAVGAFTGGVSGGAEAEVLQEFARKLFGPKLARGTAKYLAPMIMKAAESGVVKNPSQILEHAASITRGNTALSSSVDKLFQQGGNKVFNEVIPEKDKQKLREHVENGDPAYQAQESKAPGQGFAKGGEVASSENNEIANHWPDQNILLNAAKARVHNHLNSIRPTPSLTRLPYDSEIKDKHKDREYDKALDLAASPLSILNKIKDGSLLPKDMAHFSAMYPEIHQELSKRITKRLTEGQLKKETKPPHKVRQAMSLFLGTNLDSSLTQPNMMAAQNVFAMQKAQKQAAPNTKSGLNKIGQNAMTPDQARAERQNKA